LDAAGLEYPTASEEPYSWPTHRPKTSELVRGAAKGVSSDAIPNWEKKRRQLYPGSARKSQRPKETVERM
jgi:hypothetical protein